MADFYAEFSELFKVVQGAAQQPAYLVGGAVRDAMLDRPVNDLDFVLASNARSIARKVANTLGGGFYVLDDTRDTARVLYRKEEGGPKMVLDFATFRAGDLEGDLRARDFTINAMALDISGPGKVIDPTGGAQDLLNRQLRSCGPDSLSSDPVRVLRAVRLSLSLGFKIAQETAAAIRAAAILLPRISPERVRDELFRIFDGRQVATALRLMDHFGILAQVLPELETLKDVTQSAPHVSDVWEHTLATVQHLEELFAVLVGNDDGDQAANIVHSTAALFLGRYRQQFQDHFSLLINPNRSLRSLLFFAALNHDIGKPGVRTVEPDGRTHFYEHDNLGAEIIEARARDLALSNTEVQRVALIVREHMRIHHLANSGDPPSRRSIYRFFRATDDAGVDIILLSLADTLATYGVTLTQERWESELSVCRVMLESLWESPHETVRPQRLLTGSDLMEQFGLQPGPQIGKLLEALREAQATGEVKNREEALQFVENRLQSEAL